MECGLPWSCNPDCPGGQLSPRGEEQGSRVFRSPCESRRSPHEGFPRLWVASPRMGGTLLDSSCCPRLLLNDVSPNVTTSWRLQSKTKQNKRGVRACVRARMRACRARSGRARPSTRPAAAPRRTSDLVYLWLAFVVCFRKILTLLLSCYPC